MTSSKKFVSRPEYELHFDSLRFRVRVCVSYAIKIENDAEDDDVTSWKNFSFFFLFSALDEISARRKSGLVLVV